MKGYEIPFSWMRWVFPGCLWNAAQDKGGIFLTFDDGPDPEVTPFVLEQLREYNAKATFFCIGERIRKHPRIFENIYQEGHVIGNHTYRHENGWKTTTRAYLESINGCEEEINRYQIQSHQYFRPPYGRLTWRQYRMLRRTFRIVMWSDMPGDFDASLNKEAALKKLQRIKGGSIVVLHDNIKSFENLKVILPYLLKYHSERGVRFISLPALS